MSKTLRRSLIIGGIVLLTAAITLTIVLLLTNKKVYIVGFNNQIGIVSEKENETLLVDGTSVPLHRSVKSNVFIKYESMNLDNDYENLIKINGKYAFKLSQLGASDGTFKQNKLEILGLNIIDGKILLEFVVGNNKIGNPDTFILRNIIVEVNGRDYWSKEYGEEDYLNEQVRFGVDLKSNYRRNYLKSRSLNFEINEKDLDCYGNILSNNNPEYTILVKNKDKKLSNDYYVDVEVNISDNEKISTDKRLAIIAKGSIKKTQSFLDGLLIPNDLMFASDAWAEGKHNLMVQVTSEAGYVFTKNIDFELLKGTPSKNELSFRAYEYGVSEKLDLTITKLGKEITNTNFSITPYDSMFSAHSVLNFEITKTNETSINWEGSAIDRRIMYMQVYNHKNSSWETVSTQNNTTGTITLGFDYSHDETKYVNSNKIYARVVSSPDDIIEIDSEIYHITDFQYMVQRAQQGGDGVIGTEYKNSLQALSNFVIENENNGKLVYSVMTGDFVQTMKFAEEEWVIAMENFFNPLLANNSKFGVVSGNHDVGGLSENTSAGGNTLDPDLYYDKFSANLGESVFSGFAHYGGGFEDNRSHYDLIEINGHEFLFLYLGWGSTQVGVHVSSKDVAYAKTVLDMYPNKTVVLAVHEYLKNPILGGTIGVKTSTAEYLFNQLVKPYSQIKFVLSGHINGSSKLVDFLDDNNDGINDRAVLQLLTDYQEDDDLFGASFIRRLGLDFEGNKIRFDLYSPYFNDYEVRYEEHYPSNNANKYFVYDFDLSKTGYGFKTTFLG